jgi:DNA polymerase III epsilon subunit-like protein
MIVLDIEATGTDAEKHSIISIGAVDLDHPEQIFNESCRIWDEAHIDPFALEYTGVTEAQIKDPTKPTDAEIVQKFFDWVNEREDRTIAGQNPMFDLGYLRATARRNGINITLAHRSIDQHTIVYYHMLKRGMTPPIDHHHSAINSDFIMEYVGIPTEPKPHIAINGATWEAEALSRLLYDKPLLAQFEKYSIPWLSNQTQH